jgi:hypothetical protein
MTSNRDGSSPAKFLIRKASSSKTFFRFSPLTLSTKLLSEHMSFRFSKVSVETTFPM